MSIARYENRPANITIMDEIEKLKESESKNIFNVEDISFEMKGL